VSTDSTNSPRVRLFVPMSFEGVTAAAILREVLDPNIQIDTRYVASLDFRDYEQFKGAEVTIVCGLAYMGYALPEEFYVEVDIPFQDFIHNATYGEPINGVNIVSTVNEDSDPIKDICTFLRMHPESSIIGKYTNFTANTDKMIEAVNAYRTWTWDDNSTTKVLLALYQAFYKYMPRMIKGKSLQEIVKEYAPIIKGQFDKMEDLITKKVATAQTYNVKVAGIDCILKVAFADEYINELANRLLNSESSTSPVIVCVGRTTRGSDMFSIRTRNIHAGSIAHIINKGSGKESVASVFTDVAYAKLMGNGIVTALTQYEG